MREDRKRLRASGVRSFRLHIEGHGFAPDVRKGCAFPELALMIFEATPRTRRRSLRKQKLSTESDRLSAHRAAEPQLLQLDFLEQLEFDRQVLLRVLAKVIKQLHAFG